MTSLLIIIVMVVTLLGAAGYGLISGMQSLQAQNEKLATQARLEEAARGVIANIVPISSPSAQYYAVPAPTNASSPAVPSWITPNARTVDGTAFLYCPFSNRSSGTKATTITTPNGTYAANVETLFTNSKNYVTSSDARPGNASSALAIIVAPSSKSSTTPDCQDITASSTLAGALVRVITEEEVHSRSIVTATNGMEIYVAGSSSTGTGTGNNSSNGASFNTAIIYLQAFNPQYAWMRIASGSFSITPAEGTPSATYVSNGRLSNQRNASIRFSGAGVGSTIISASGSLAHLRPNANQDVEDITFPTGGSSNLFVRNATQYDRFAILGNVNIQNFYVYGGRVYALRNYTIGGSTVQQSNSVTYVTGRFYLNSTVTPPANANWTAGQQLFNAYGLATFGPSFSISPSSITGSRVILTGASAGYDNSITFMGTLTGSSYNSSAFGIVGEGGRFVFSGATISGLTNSFVYSRGKVVVDRNTSVIFESASTQIGTSNEEGSSIALTNSSIGSLSDNTLRPGSATANVYVNQGRYSGVVWPQGGTTGGWSAGSIAARTTSNCWNSVNTYTSYHLHSDSLNTNGSTLLPRGTSTANAPLVIANRANWSCVK